MFGLQHSLGVDVDVKRVASFKQSELMASYLHRWSILENCRKHDKHVFCFSIQTCVISASGKPCEGVKHRQNWKLTVDRAESKRTSNLECKLANFRDGLVLIQTRKTATAHVKSCYIGCASLAWPRARMMDSRCGCIEKRFLWNWFFFRRRFFIGNDARTSIVGRMLCPTSATFQISLGRQSARTMAYWAMW